MSTQERLRRHAALVAEQELNRRSSLLSSMPPHKAAAIIAALRDVASATADCLIDAAASEPALGAALGTIYGTDVAEARRRVVRAGRMRTNSPHGPTRP